MRITVHIDACAVISSGKRLGRISAAHEVVRTQAVDRCLPAQSLMLLLTGQLKNALSVCGRCCRHLLRQLSPIHLFVLCRLQVLQATGTPMMPHSPQQQSKRSRTVRLLHNFPAFFHCTSRKPCPVAIGNSKTV